jgi:ABC-2 type transport system permease protein
MTGNIINLVRRDFYALMSEKVAGFSFLLVFMISVVTTSRLSYWTLFFLFMIFFSYIQNVFQMEEKYRTESFYASLPVRRCGIVMARYAGVAFIAGIYILVVYIANALMLYLNVKNVQPIPASYCVNVLLTLALTTSITYPFYFRFGITKAKAVSMIIIMAGALATGTCAAMSKSNGAAMLTAQSGFFLPNGIITTIILIAAAVLLLGVTIPLTLTLYAKKDL